MASSTQTLLDYLMVASPGLPAQETNKTPNTTNDSYSWRDINTVGRWTVFTYSHILHRYGDLLQSALIPSDPMPNSALQPIKTKPMFAVWFATYIQSRLRRALRVGFQHLEPQSNLHITPVTVDIRQAVQVVDNIGPDVAFIQAGSTLNSSRNRCPGILTLSWNWCSNWASTSFIEDHREYKQVLSQVNFYMNQHDARYSFVLTDTELMPIKKLDGNGNLLVAQSIPWEAKGPERMTVLLGLWYLGMLSATDIWQL